LNAQFAGDPLTTISAIAPSIGNALAQLISGGSSGPATPVATSTNSASSSATTSTGSSGSATFVTLSDQAKAVAATKAQSDQTAADNLQAYVEAHRVTGNGTGTQTTGTSSADAQSATGSKVEAIVAQIKALADANEPPPFQSFTPTKSLSNSVTFDGYTLTVDTNAGTQFYGTELSGNGTQVYDKHFGPSDEAGGGTGAPPGVAISSAIVDNNEALDAITITQNTATASSASISSSSAGSISTSSVNAQSSSITFLVNYATGQISVAGSAASVSAQSTRVSPPGSALSTLA
jgi:hypothetical protein